MNSKLKAKKPVAIQWRIPENRLQKIKNSLFFLNRTMFESSCSYAINVFPNGNSQECRGQTWIFINLLPRDLEEIEAEQPKETEDGQQKETEAELSVSIESANVSKKFSQGGNIFSWKCKLCTTEELFDPKFKYIFDGEMIVTIDGFVMLEKNIPAKPFDLGSGAESLGVNLWNQETKDFVIVVDGKEIKAHKIILSAWSSVFAAMVKPHTKEAQENKVMIPDFTYDVVEAAIKLCYHSSLVEYVSLEDQMTLLQFFDKYDMQMLKEKLEEYMISEINKYNVCRFVNCSLLSNSQKLKKKCAEFLQECMDCRQPICDFDILDKNFCLDIMKKSFYHVVE